MIWLKIGITGNDSMPCLPDGGTPGPGPHDPDPEPPPDEKPPPPPPPPDDKPPKQ